MQICPGENGQAMGTKKNEAAPSKKRDKLILGGAFLGVSFWMFCLGILVGRGTAPVHFDIKALQKQLAALKQASVEKSRKGYLAKKPPLKFYEALKAPPETAPPALAGIPPAAKDTTAAQARDARAPDHGVAMIKRAEKFKKPVKAGNLVQAPGWTVQVAALRGQADADRMVARLIRKGFAAYRLTEKVPGKGTWHRVRVGHFRQRQEAQTEMEKLKRDHYSPFLIKEESP